MRSVCRKLKEAQAEHASISASLAAASEATELSKAAAAERQKRFALLNTQFKKREQALQKQVEEEREARAADKAQVQYLSAQQSVHEQARFETLP